MINLLLYFQNYFQYLYMRNLAIKFKMRVTIKTMLFKNSTCLISTQRQLQILHYEKNFSCYVRKSEYSLETAGNGIKQYREDVAVI
jgi:hypothetical protein